MLAKLKIRYSSDQMKILKTCTLLDIRNKSTPCVEDHYNQLEQDVIDILNTNREAVENQVVIPAPEGPERDNLPSLDMNASAANHSIFDYEDDIVVGGDTPPLLESESIKAEIRLYKKLTMLKADKDKCNVLEWWKKNRAKFPYLFQAAQACLHIPATSVPAERIFSLAGYVVRSRRSKILPINVNKSIFLKKNAKHVPAKTNIFASS